MLTPCPPEISLPACLVCHSKQTEFWAESWDTEFQTTSDPFQYFRCLHCEVLFINPVPLDRLDEIYPSNYNSNLTQASFTGKIKIWLDKRILSKLIKNLPGNSLKSLDIGGGYGLQMDTIREIDPRIKSTHIVDIDKVVKTAVEKKGHHFFCGRIEDFHSDLKFDLILALNLIEHVASPEQLLRKIEFLLTKEGLVLIKTPNYRSLDARLFRRHNWTGYHCPRHWVLFHRNNLETLANSVGLEVQEFSYTQGAPFWAQSLLSWFAKMHWIKVEKERPICMHPLIPLLQALFAAFDFLRRPFSRTSQMFFVLRKANTA